MVVQSHLTRLHTVSKVFARYVVSEGFQTREKGLESRMSPTIPNPQTFLRGNHVRRFEGLGLRNLMAGLLDVLSLMRLPASLLKEVPF